MRVFNSAVDWLFGHNKKPVETTAYCNRKGCGGKGKRRQLKLLLLNEPKILIVKLFTYSAL